MKSRLGTVVEKFTPMSVIAALQGKPPGSFAPIGKGMTRAKLGIELEKVFSGYADPTIWEKIQGMPGYERRLDLLAPDLIEAGKANGMNAKDIREVVLQAKTRVQSDWNNLFWRAINTKNDRLANHAAEAIVRLGGGYSSVARSFDAKQQHHTPEMTHGQIMTAVQRYIQEASAHVKQVEQEY